MSLKTRPKYPTLQFIKDLWHFFKIHKGQFIFYTILLVFASLLGLIPAIITAKIIDFFVDGGTSYNIFYTYLGLLFGVMFFNTFLRLGSKHYFSVYTNKIQKHAKVESF